MKYVTSFTTRCPRLLLGLGILFALFLGWSATDRAAQNKEPPKPRTEEEEDVPPPKRKIHDDEDSKPIPSRPGANPSGDLRQLAREAKNPDLRLLYSELAVPYDVVTKMRGEAVYPPIRVLPLETYYSGTVTQKNGPPQFTPLDDEDKPLKPQELEADFFYKSIQPYELVALNKLDKLRKDRNVADYEELLAEEQIVSAVLRFHNSAKASSQRKGDWSDVEHRLRTRLMEVMLKQFTLVTEASDWETAFTLASRLADTFPGETEQQVIAPLILDMVQKALAAKQGPSINTTQLRDIHVRLRALTEQFPSNLQMQKLKQSLKSQAEKLLAEAVALEKSTNKKDLALAQEKLNQAAELWPTLPGLENHLLNVTRKARVLKVGMRQPLIYMSPNTARTDSELRVVDMLFESLVKFSPDASGKGHYRSGLAEGRAQVVELGRRFQLSPNALWWDGQTAEAVSLNDIRATFRAFKRGDGPDHSLAWENLYGDTEVTGGSDGMGVTVRLSKGYLEPLSLMNLKIVPARACKLEMQKNLASTRSAADHSSTAALLPIRASCTPSLSPT